MQDNITTQFKTEGQPAFPVADTEIDNSASSSGEETTTQTQSDEGEQTHTEEATKGVNGEKGFADHPRWKERENDWTTRFNEQEQRHTDELSKVTSTMQDTVAKAVENALKNVGIDKTSEKAIPEEIPSWFGGDEKDWASFSKWNQQQISQAEERGAKKAQDAIENKTNEQQKAIDAATQYMNNEIMAIESDKALNPTGAKIDKNKLLKITLDNELVDIKGNWNYRAAYRIMQGESSSKEEKTNATEERKKLAGAITSEKSETNKNNSNVVTSDTFNDPQQRPW